jgi:tRNA pseudouridine55 synthase
MTTPSYDLETEIDQTFSAYWRSYINYKTAWAISGWNRPNHLFFQLKKKKKKRRRSTLPEHAQSSSRKLLLEKLHLRICVLPWIGHQIDFRVCSKGTYIRLLFWLWKAMESGSHLTAMTN